MNKLEIAKALQESSKKYENFLALYIKYFSILTKLKSPQDKKLTNFDICLDCVEKLDLSIMDWELFEVQTHIEYAAYSYIFVNRKIKKLFDVSVYDDGRLVAPSYTFALSPFRRTIQNFCYFPLLIEEKK